MVILSLRNLLGVTIGTIVALLAVLHGNLTGRQAEAVLNQEVGTSLSGIAEGLSARLNGDMQARAALAQVLSQVQALEDPATAQRIVDQMSGQDPALAWAGITDKDGKVLAGTRGILVGQSLSQRPVYREGIKGLFLGDVHEAVLLAKLLPNDTGEPLRFVDVSAPIRSADGTAMGVVAIHYSWDWARRLVSDPQSPVQSRAGVETILVAADNNVLLGPPDLRGTMLHLESVRRARDGMVGWRVERWPDGQDYMTGFAADQRQRVVKGLGWAVLVRQPVSIAYAPADRMRYTIFWSGLALATLFGALGWLVAHHIASPLRAIARSARAITKGVPGATIPAVGGAKEIDTLSRSLRELVSSLRASNRALVATNAALERMESIAYQDRLTALPNRRFFEQYLDVALMRARQGHDRMVILYLDLDGFKPVNDQMGHEAGDEVLRQVGLRLASSLRQEDVVARIGGDEFACILVVSEAEADFPREVALRLIAAVNEPMSLGEQTVRVGCTIGAACWPHDGDEPRDVLRLADAALYAAKRQGKNRVAFHGEAGYTSNQDG